MQGSTMATTLPKLSISALQIGWVWGLFVLLKNENKSYILCKCWCWFICFMAVKKKKEKKERRYNCDIPVSWLVLCFPLPATARTTVYWALSVAASPVRVLSRGTDLQDGRWPRQSGSLSGGRHPWRHVGHCGSGEKTAKETAWPGERWVAEVTVNDSGEVWDVQLPYSCWSLGSLFRSK